MKKLLFILLIILLFFSSTKKPAIYSDVFTTRQAPLHYSVFQDISVLISFAPDSAFMLVKAISDTLDEAKMTPPDRHEYNILLAETLYKNDYPQLNDTAVNAAALFFDSVAALHPENLDLQYQKARAYYYKGVGDNEKDDIVEACKDYLTALEVMESCFGKADGDYEKIRFKALTYSRLAELFYYEDATQAAMEMYKEALILYNKINDSLFATYTTQSIGIIYQMDKKNDSALIFYKEALTIAENQHYSNLFAGLLNYISDIYNLQGEHDSAWIYIRKAIENTDNEDSYLGFCYTVGELFHEEGQYDSAAFYFEKNFSRDGIDSKIASSKMLMEIYKSLGNKAKEDFYTRKNAEYSEIYVKKVPYKIEMLEFYNDFHKRKVEKEKQIAVRRLNMIILVLSAVTILSLLFFRLRYMRKKRIYEKEKTESREVMEEALKQKEAIKGRYRKVKEEADNKKAEVLKAGKKLEEMRKKSEKAKIESEEAIQKSEKAKQESEKTKKELHEVKVELEKARDVVIQTVSAENTKSIEERWNEFNKTEIAIKIKSSYNNKVMIKGIADLSESAMKEEELTMMVASFDSAFGNFSLKLNSDYPQLKPQDIQYCILTLMNFTNKTIAVIMSTPYKTLYSRAKKMESVFSNENKQVKDIKVFLKYYLATRIVVRGL